MGLSRPRAPVMKKLSECLVFGGKLARYEHDSEVLHCKMFFSLFTPPSAGTPVPVCPTVGFLNLLSAVVVPIWLDLH